MKLPSRWTTFSKLLLAILASLDSFSDFNLAVHMDAWARAHPRGVLPSIIWNKSWQRPAMWKALLGCGGWTQAARPWRCRNTLLSRVLSCRPLAWSTRDQSTTRALTVTPLSYSHQRLRLVISSPLLRYFTSLLLIGRYDPVILVFCHGTTPCSCYREKVGYTRMLAMVASYSGFPQTQSGISASNCVHVFAESLGTRLGLWLGSRGTRCLPCSLGVKCTNEAKCFGCVVRAMYGGVQLACFRLLYA